jgi:hypothetical protein
MLTRRRANRLPVRRYAGGYAQSRSGFLWHPRVQVLSGALESQVDRRPSACRQLGRRAKRDSARPTASGGPCREGRSPFTACPPGRSLPSRGARRSR